MHTSVEMDQQHNMDRKQTYLFCTMLYKNGFKGVSSWNLFETGHGNWAADGFGGDLKWTVDKVDLKWPRPEQCQCLNLI